MIVEVLCPLGCGEKIPVPVSLAGNGGGPTWQVKVTALPGGDQVTEHRRLFHPDVERDGAA